MYYVVFGGSLGDLRLSRSKYRCEGVPEGIELLAYGPTTHPEVMDEFRQGYLWEELVKKDPGLAKSVAAQVRCVVVKGSVADEPTLNFFRDTIGLLTCMLDSGGVAIFDPQGFKWWLPSAWRASSSPPRHCRTSTSPSSFPRSRPVLTGFTHADCENSVAPT